MTMHAPTRLFDLRSPVELASIVKTFPTIANASPHASRSDKYRVIPTLPVLDSLVADGFRVHDAQVARVRDKSKIGFEKHLIRLRHVDHTTGFGRNVGDEAPELTLINSHDGGSAWTLILGIIRFACANGLIVGRSWGHYTVRHSGNPEVIAKAVTDAAHTARDGFGKLADTIERYKATTLNSRDMEEFATRAHALRWPVSTDPDKPTRAPVSPLMLVDNVRREADDNDDLWTVLNRVQENLTKGGIQGRMVGSNGRTRRTTLRAMTGIDASVGLNRDLFDLAEQYAVAA